MQSRPATFHLVMIKPAHYGDDGYPIQWLLSAVPSNTLACLNGIAEDCRNRQVLGPATSLIITTFDETNQRIRPSKILKTIKPGDRALIALVGVQSNQFPRAVDLARPFREKSIPVCIGGFHVSGCLSMLPEMPDDLKEAQALGISLFAGEAEDGRLDTVLKDAFEGALKPLYNFMSDLPDMANQPMPILPLSQVRRTAGTMSSFDLGRGCPYQCSFCTIINVQGRKSRFRSPNDLEAIIRRLAISPRRKNDDFSASRRKGTKSSNIEIRQRSIRGAQCVLPLTIISGCQRRRDTSRAPALTKERAHGWAGRVCNPLA